MIRFAFQDSPKQGSGKWLVQAVPKDCEIFMQVMSWKRGNPPRAARLLGLPNF